MLPKLFILKPSFPDPNVGAGVFFCPHSAMVEGLLSFYPKLREQLDVRYVDFPRPRHEVISEVGEANQACPVLVLPQGWKAPEIPGRTANGRHFFVGATEIGTFLAGWAGIGLPHP